MKANEIANTNWQNKDATNALAELVMEMLSESEPMGTTRLVGKLLPSASTKQTKALLSHLYNARVAGLLDGYWTQGKPNGGTFGKPSYQWHAPAEPIYTIRTGREITAEEIKARRDAASK